MSQAASQCSGLPDFTEPGHDHLAPAVLFAIDLQVANDVIPFESYGVYLAEGDHERFWKFADGFLTGARLDQQLVAAAREFEELRKATAPVMATCRNAREQCWAKLELPRGWRPFGSS